MKGTKMFWVGRVLSGFVMFPFFYSAAAKLFPQIFYPQIIEQMAGIGLPASILPTLAFLEVLCIVTYVIPKTSVLGAILFTGYLGGAILTHLRVGQNVTMQVTLGILIWLGLYLREPRLKPLLPFRR